MPEVSTQTDVDDYIHTLPENQQAYLHRATAIQKMRTTRIGYPVTGPIYGNFTATGWEKDEKNRHKLIDNSILGIVPGSPADTLMINIGGQLPILNGKAVAKSGAWQAEIEIIQMLAKYYNIPQEKLRGYVTSGGTEGNLACLWWLREFVLSKASSHSSVPQSPILYVSEQQHYSIAKIADILNIEQQIITADRQGNLNIADLSAVMRSHMIKYPLRPIIMCAIAGTTQLGGIDNLPQIHAILSKEVGNKKGVFAIHVDGALLGAVLPLTQPFGQISSLFDYADSLAISGHKFFGTTSICGIALAKREILEATYTNKDITVKYVGGIQDTTISGTRSGFIVMELHNALTSLNLNTHAGKLKKLVDQCLVNAKYLHTELVKIIGLNDVIYNPKQFVVVFPKPKPENAANLLQDKYGLMTVGHSAFGICVTAAVDSSLINKFLHDYKECFIKKIPTTAFFAPPAPTSLAPDEKKCFLRSRL